MSLRAARGDCTLAFQGLLYLRGDAGGRDIEITLEFFNKGNRLPLPNFKGKFLALPLIQK